MRLALHLCDNNDKAREQRIKDGKKFIDCAKYNESIEYFSKNIIGLDVITELPDL